MIDWKEKEKEMRVSRTELKKAHERLQRIATPLANLSKKQMKNLPASEFFLDELMALPGITSASARNRQIKRVGKMISEEDRHALVDALFQARFSKEQAVKIVGWIPRLNIHDESTLKQFMGQFKEAERHTLYQLLLWVEYAKHIEDDELLEESENDLLSYIKEVAILTQLG